MEENREKKEKKILRFADGRDHRQTDHIFADGQGHRKKGDVDSQPVASSAMFADGHVESAIGKQAVRLTVAK
jgi:hypothetical protein